MREEAGDLWTYPADARVITTNTIVKADGCLVMGAGVALQARKRHPGIDRRLGAFVKAHGDKLCYMQNLGLIAMPTKRDWKKKSDIKLIEQGARKLMELADFFDLKTVVMPRPGCGNGGLHWEIDVRPLLEGILDGRFVVLQPAAQAGVSKEDFMLI